MALMVLATDTENTNLKIGRFTEILFDVHSELGNTEFITGEVLR